MPAVKALDRISAKWKRVAQVSQAEYEAGIQNPRTDWAQASTAAASSYEAGVQAAIQQKRYQQGVTKAGTAKWKANAIEKGPSRWAQGINVAGNAYEQGFAPYRTVIEQTTLPARGPKGSPQNIQRVAVIADALHKLKVSKGLAMLTILKVLKWLASGGLDKVTDLISAFWAVFKEISDLLGVPQTPEKQARADELNQHVAQLQNEKKARV